VKCSEARAVPCFVRIELELRQNVFLTGIRWRVNSNLDVTLEARILFNERYPTNPLTTLMGKERPMLEVILKRFEKPDEVRTFERDALK